MPDGEKISTKILVTILSVIVGPIVVLAVREHYWPDKPTSQTTSNAITSTAPTSVETPKPSAPSLSQPAPDHASASRHTIPEALRMDYESVKNRCDTAEVSLRDRFKDVSTGIKPSILSDIETCRSDLSAAKANIDHANVKAVQQRLEHAKHALARLEAL